MIKKHQHRQSVETLRLGGDGDMRTLEKVAEIIKTVTPEQPFIRNAVERIHQLTGDTPEG